MNAKKQAAKQELNDLLKRTGLYPHRRVLGIGLNAAFVATDDLAEVLSTQNPLSLPHNCGFVTGINQKLGLSIGGDEGDDLQLGGVYWCTETRAWKGVYKVLGRHARNAERRGALVLVIHEKEKRRIPTVIVPATGIARLNASRGRAIVDLFGKNEPLFYQEGANVLLTAKRVSFTNEEEWLGSSQYPPRTFYVYANPVEDIERKVNAFKRTMFDPHLEHRQEHAAVAS